MHSLRLSGLLSPSPHFNWTHDGGVCTGGEICIDAFPPSAPRSLCLPTAAPTLHPANPVQPSVCPQAPPPGSPPHPGPAPFGARAHSPWPLGWLMHLQRHSRPVVSDRRGEFRSPGDWPLPSLHDTGFHVPGAQDMCVEQTHDD